MNKQFDHALLEMDEEISMRRDSPVQFWSTDACLSKPSFSALELVLVRSPLTCKMICKRFLNCWRRKTRGVRDRIFRMVIIVLCKVEIVKPKWDFVVSGFLSSHCPPLFLSLNKPVWLDRYHGLRGSSKVVSYWWSPHSCCSKRLSLTRKSLKKTQVAGGDCGFVLYCKQP